MNVPLSIATFAAHKRTLKGEAIHGTAQTEMKEMLPQNAEAVKADSQDPPSSVTSVTKCGQEKNYSWQLIDKSTTRNAKLLGNGKVFDCLEAQLVGSRLDHAGQLGGQRSL